MLLPVGQTPYLFLHLLRQDVLLVKRGFQLLDPFKDQIQQWVTEDHCTNCEVMLVRLREMGYTGGISILKECVHPLRPAVAGQAPVQRYETKPGEQVRFD